MTIVHVAPLVSAARPAGSVGGINVQCSRATLTLFVLLGTAPQHAVLSHRWEPAHGGEWSPRMDEILLPDLSVHSPVGAVRQDYSKGEI